ncbi:MAG: MFS transporter [Verrucomicrobia bacterium]|nr:MFS transporter [Verrucomicrobiota bacterium]
MTTHRIVLGTLLLTLFLDYFNLGLVYPLFSALIFESDLAFSEGVKNVLYGALIAAFPLGQFFGAPVIGAMSDHYGRRRLLIFSLVGTVFTLLLCGLAVQLHSFFLLILGRLLGGLMAGNMTLAFAALAETNSPEEKVRNFALVPFAASIGFACGPFVASLFSEVSAGPFFLAAVFSLSNLGIVFWAFPPSILPQTKQVVTVFSGLRLLTHVIRPHPLRRYFWVLFLAVSSNYLFVQYMGPFAIEKLAANVRGVGYLYTNLGIGAALGNLILTRHLAKYFSVEKALKWGLIALIILPAVLPIFDKIAWVHILAFITMLAYAVGYTNSMALVSNRGEKQGETMGVCVSLQCCAEFLPALVVSFATIYSMSFSMLAAALFAAASLALLLVRERVDAAAKV